jgi:bifunctional non-homologous end joining protein LigD
MNVNTLPHIDLVIPRKKALPFDDPDWHFEIKYDGFRGALYREKNALRLMSKEDKRLPFANLEQNLAKCLPHKDLILDGEVVSLNQAGWPVFRELLSRRSNIVYIAFDILWLKGKDLREMPFYERRKILEEFARDTDQGCIRSAFGIKSRGIDLFNAACEQDLEGIVAKRVASPYSRRTEWLKILNPYFLPSSAEMRRR